MSLLFVLILLCLGGCADFRAGVLGDYPGGPGSRPSGSLPPGAVYQDPARHFTSIVVKDESMNVVPHRTGDYGVVLDGRMMERGDRYYAVQYYPIPSTEQGDDAPFLRKYVEKFVAMHAQQTSSEVSIVKESETRFKGFPAMDVYYVIYNPREKKDPHHITLSSSKGGFVGRMVKAKDTLFFMYYKNAWDSPSIDDPKSLEGGYNMDKDTAEEFFDGVTIL